MYHELVRVHTKEQYIQLLVDGDGKRVNYTMLAILYAVLAFFLYHLVKVRVWKGRAEVHPAVQILSSLQF